MLPDVKASFPEKLFFRSENAAKPQPARGGYAEFRICRLTLKKQVTNPKTDGIIIPLC